MTTESENKKLSELVNQRQKAEWEVRQADKAIKKIQAQSGQ